MSPYLKVLRQDLIKVGKGIACCFAFAFAIISAVGVIYVLPLLEGGTDHWHGLPNELKWLTGWGAVCWVILIIALLFFWTSSVVERVKQEKDDE